VPISGEVLRTSLPFREVLLPVALSANLEEQSFEILAATERYGNGNALLGGQWRPSPNPHIVQPTGIASRIMRSNSPQCLCCSPMPRAAFFTPTPLPAHCLATARKNCRDARLVELLPELSCLPTEPAASRETVCQRHDGRRLAVELLLRRTVIEGATCQFAFLREIDDRKRLEEQLREARKMETLGRLVAGVSHDFNNLLTAILIYGGLLLNQLPGESPLRRQVEHINVAAERGRSLVAQLAALGGQRGFEPARLSLNEVVERVHDMLSRLVGEHVLLETCHEEGVATVWADRAQMEQVLVNLAVNARDAMPQGGVLRIATSNLDLDEVAAQDYPELPPGKYVRLSVSDSGCGMDEHTRTHALDPFFTTKPPGHGTGLGLSTVHEFVRQSQGQIILRGAPGQGTQVEVLLPAVEGEPEQIRRARRELQLSGAGTVLVVEDDELVRRSLNDILAGKGYRVLQARNAREAELVGRTHEGAIDLVLADLVLPGLSGPELVEKLRADRPGMQVLYISGYREDDDRVRRLVDAGKAFFPKTLHRLCDRRESAPNPGDGTAVARSRG